MSRNLLKRSIQSKLEETKRMLDYHTKQLIVYQSKISLLEELLGEGGNDNGSSNSSNG